MMYCCLGLLLAGLAWGQVSAQQSQSCYVFRGDAHLEFYTSSLNISGSAYYKLKFKTSEPSGIVLYAEGDHDYEGLFVHNGRLTYLLTNPSPSGVEGTTGGLYQSTWPVNNGTWVTVEVYRNYRSKDRAPMSDNELRTGFIIYSREGGKVLESHLDHINHRGVVLNPNIYLGGISSSVAHARGSPVPSFNGEIKDIKELKSGLDFTSFTVNPEGKVTRCSS